MDISKRIRTIISHYGLSVRAFEKSIGASNNSIQIMIKRNADAKAGLLNKILQKYPEINPVWLLTGEGKMFKTAEISLEIQDLALLNALEEQIKTLKENALLLREMLAIRQKEVAALEKKLNKCEEKKNTVIRSHNQ